MTTQAQTSPKQTADPGLARLVEDAAAGRGKRIGYPGGLPLGVCLPQEVFERMVRSVVVPNSDPLLIKDLYDCLSHPRVDVPDYSSNLLDDPADQVGSLSLNRG